MLYPSELPGQVLIFQLIMTAYVYGNFLELDTFLGLLDTVFTTVLDTPMLSFS